ncbi:hypothetical protein OG568_21595 [Streptomyces sp. NBC_01450]|uniref:hypothetical protein n=1 Tax=Streptomyces sp. NBC_01450 TaxID=2903871 RepID=UPI002E3381D7|nr:hypothetical protein [Streptomyces sp. NBC_01450]
MVADIIYDGSNRVAKVNDTYYASGAPSSTLFLPVNSDVDAQTVAECDGASRATASIFKVAGTEKCRTTYAYGGDRVTANPPAGQPATTVVSDARGQATTRIEYPTGGDAVTKSYGGYTPSGQLSKVTDDAGNVWSYEYDQLGRQKTAVDPDTGTSTLTYDEMDRPTSVTLNGTKTSTPEEMEGFVKYVPVPPAGRSGISGMIERLDSFPKSSEEPYRRS